MSNALLLAIKPIKRLSVSVVVVVVLFLKMRVVPRWKPNTFLSFEGTSLQRRHIHFEQQAIVTDGRTYLGFHPFANAFEV